MERLEEQLREAIIDSGLSQSRLAELSGISQTQISRFIRNERTLTLESASKIAEVLELELKPKRK